MQLSTGQEKALRRAGDWYKKADFKNHPFFYLSGYAGTGKTTIESIFEEDIEGRIVRACYTGKAAMRLQQVCGKSVSTIHSTIYKPVNEERDSTGRLRPKFNLNFEDSSLVGASLLVLDECSMINKDIGEDILKFKVPVLVLGDPGQLPPIHGSGYFTDRKPDALLTEVHRQALDNPILRLATDVRNGKSLSREYLDGFKIYPYAKDYDYEAELLLADQIMTGTNKVRIKTNNLVRELKGYNGNNPVVGEKLVCLRNNAEDSLFNGLSGIVTEDKSKPFDTHLQFNLDTDIGKRKNIPVWEDCFTDYDNVTDLPFWKRCKANEFDFGYCITVHKAQGSQWDKVLILDDGFLSWDKATRSKWLYTGITRAVKELVIVQSTMR